MWFQFGSITEREFESKAGKPYTAFELVGIKKGWQSEPDSEWSRKIFRQDAVTVIENGVKRPGISLVSYFQNAVKPGDVIIVKQERNGSFWDIKTVEKLGAQNGGEPEEYTPLDAEQAPALKEAEELPADYEPAPWAA